MKWITKLKKKFNLDKKKDSDSDNDNQAAKSFSKNSNSNLKNISKTSPYDYEALGKMKIHKRPIISDYDERKQLHNQITKELEKID